MVNNHLRRRLWKKAQETEQQFNWIFILIVGVLILAFFAYVVLKQKAASEVKLAVTITKQLNTILTGAKLSSGAFQDIPIPETTIRFSCDDYFIGDVSQRLGNRILFAPNFVEGNRIFTWTLDWNIPFKVSSFLYVTTPLVRYMLVPSAAEESQHLAKRLNSTLPAKINKEIIADIDLPNAVNLNDKRVRIILIQGLPAEPAPAIPQSLAGVEVSALVIDPVQKKVQFYEESGAGLVSTGSPMDYLDDASLFGAIFTESRGEYECSMNKAYDRLNSAAKIYARKFVLISNNYVGTACEGFYKGPGLQGSPEQEGNQDLLSLVASTTATPVDVKKIPESVQNLLNTNTKLQLNSCPLLF
ncbi:hypothetical protein HZB03_05755 [Candidatus Woesearchaeota archaeon]|nr:hypothetical protein [Candidatus Woesearchaeota archaeon]